jgi:hypothetical protein
MTQSTLNYNVTEKDCGVENGLVMDPAADHISGRTLAQAVDDVPAGSVVDRQLLARLRRAGKPVMLRSAMTCRAGHGLCAKCAGVQADGKFPNVGDSIGVTAAQALGEPIVQGSLNCLSVNELVRMADFTVRRVIDIKAGDWVLGADKYGNTFPVEVTAIHDQGDQPLQRYTYKLGATKGTVSVDCTEIHELLQSTYYTGAKEESMNYIPRKLPAGRKSGQLSAVFPASCRCEGVDEPLAKILGYFVGDGIRSALHGLQCKVSCACRRTREDLDAFLAPFGLILRKKKRSHDWSVSWSDKCPRTGHPVKQRISELGWLGKYAHEKTLPAEVWRWSDESIADFLAGFVSADGSCYQYGEGSTVGVSFASTSKALLEGLKDLMRVRLCVYSTEITRTDEAGSRNYTHDMWAFTVTRRDQVRRLSALISHRIPGDKGEALMEYLREGKPSLYDDATHYRGKRCRVEHLGVLPAWDISVNHPDELFVLANGLIVSNTKHNAGMAKGKKSFSGLAYISQFLSIPEEFKDRAAVSEISGVVTKIEDAPQGGTFITVDGERHFALPGFAPLVKPGQQVEAGDALSEGLINPADIVRLRGLGEGRKYYADRLSQMLRDSGQKPDARNVEILARAALDNYMIDDPDEDSPWLPDDLVRESELLSRYKPPVDTVDAPVTKAAGKYLQAPSLHYTVGTKLTPRMVKSLQDAGVDRVSVSGTEPWFHPEMKRLRVAAHDSGDWMAAMGTSYLGAQIRNSLERGDETNVAENYHFGPRLAYGADAGAGAFGENIERTGKF